MVQLEMEQKADKRGGVEKMQKQAETCGGSMRRRGGWCREVSEAVCVCVCVCVALAPVFTSFWSDISACSEVGA